jgi:hypothetical protein
MRTLLSAAAALTLLAACNPAADTDNPAVATDEAVAERQASAPAEGATSFTEGQARDRLVERGYSDPIQLMRAEDGSWRGTATQNGQSVNVVVDYQGNVTTGQGATPPSGQ